MLINRKNIAFRVFCFFILLGLISCTSSSSDVFPLRSSSWRLVELNNQPVSSNEKIILIFNQHGKITGQAPCNDYYAFYKQRGKYLIFAEAASSKKECGLSGNSLDKEEVFIQNLEKVRSFNVDGNKLIFYDEYYKSLMAFTR